MLGVKNFHRIKGDGEELETRINTLGHIPTSKRQKLRMGTKERENQRRPNIEITRQANLITEKNP